MIYKFKMISASENSLSLVYITINITVFKFFCANSIDFYKQRIILKTKSAQKYVIEETVKF